MAKSKKSNVNSQPHTLVEKTLNTDAAKNAMRRYFDHTAEALFRIAFTVRVYLGDDTGDEVDKFVNEEMAKTITSVSDARKRMKKLLSDNGVTQETVFPAPQKFSVKVTSPAAASLLGLLSELDLLVVDLTSLWQHQVLDNKQYRDATYHYQRQVLKMMGRIRDRWFKERKKMRDQDQKDDEIDTGVMEMPDEAQQEPAKADKAPAKSKKAAQG